MMIQFNKNTQTAFSDAADIYDRHTDIHFAIGREMIRGCPAIAPGGVIADIGMGTGRLTEEIQRKFKPKQLYGIDFADGMVRQAKNRKGAFTVIQARAEDLPFQDACLDMIVSNCALQWADLNKSFREAFRCLKPGGTLVFSMFGEQTFKELFEGIHSCLPENAGASIQRLPSKGDAEKSLISAGFQNARMKREMKFVDFKSLRSFLRWTKSIGANGLKRNFFVGKNFLEKLERHYETRHETFHATLEILWEKTQKLSL